MESTKVLKKVKRRQKAGGKYSSKALYLYVLRLGVSTLANVFNIKEFHPPNTVAVISFSGSVLNI